VYINPPQEAIGTHQFPNLTVSPGLTRHRSIMFGLRVWDKSSILTLVRGDDR